MGRLTLVIIVVSGLLAAGGCNGAYNAQYITAERLANGLVMILPGIEGEGALNYDIRRGLESAGISYAMPIYNWGRPIPGVGLLLNQIDFVGNRLAGMRIAKVTDQYQQEHPGRPVYLVGHSGGGGVAVFAAASLPEGSHIDGLVLLSASISPGYDLTTALERCRNGIVNFYNEADVGLLGVGTTLLGNVDGVRGPSAGLVGFEKPKDSDPEAKKLAYGRLYERGLTPAMTSAAISHAAVTRPGFVSVYVAPWVMSPAWPADAAVSTEKIRMPLHETPIAIALSPKP